jgi:hypothetical protein
MLHMSQPTALLEIGIAIGDPLDSDLAQLHLIGGESARLVAEDVLNLAQILIQVGIARQGMVAAHRVNHLLVRVDVHKPLFSSRSDPHPPHQSFTLHDQRWYATTSLLFCENSKACDIILTYCVEQKG